MRPLTIDTARSDDADAIAALHAASWRAHYRHVFSNAYLDGPMAEEKRTFWRERLAALGPGDVVLCARGADDALLGFTTISPDPALVRGAYLFALHTMPSARGQGVGRRVMAEAARRLTALGVEQLWLHAYTANRDAIRFYTRLDGQRGATRYCEMFPGRAEETSFLWRDLPALAARADPASEARRPMALRSTDLPVVIGADHPVASVVKAKGRRKQALGDPFGLDQFGVNRVEIPPGGWSTVRHWHSHEDEFVYILSGSVTLVTDRGEAVLEAGDCAGFKAGAPDGHRLENRGGEPAIILEVGSRRPDVDEVDYSEEDLVIRHDASGRQVFLRRDGTLVGPAD